MRFFKAIGIALACPLTVCGFAGAQPMDPFQSLGNALNPKISLIGDFLGNTGPLKDPDSNKIIMREVELGFQAEVDPYARADFFASFAPGEIPAFEEGYVTLLSLPLGLRARGGKFLANFGRLNLVHRGSEMPQSDAPLVLDRFLGVEGLNDLGMEVSRSFALSGLFTEATVAVLNGLGEEPEKPAATTTVTDTNGNVVTVQVRNDSPPAQRQIRNFAQVSRLRFYGDFTDSANLELGISGLLHEPKERKETRMAALDMTFRWKPLSQGTYRSLIWRTEAMVSKRKLPPETDPVTGAATALERTLYRRGLYSYVEYQAARRWRFGVRGDYVESPEEANTTLTLGDGTVRTVEVPITRALSPYISYTLSEFNRFRVQYQNRQVPGDDVEHRVFFEWSVVLGPHGAHPF